MNLKNTIARIALPTALIVVALAAPVAAAPEYPSVEYCPPANPDAWVNVCLRLYPVQANHAMLDTSNSERVCIVNDDVCIDVPKPGTREEWSTIYSYDQESQVLPDNARQDICRITGFVGCSAPEIHFRAGLLAAGAGVEGIIVDADGETYFFPLAIE